MVTGGNRGIGLETCRQLAQRGLRVILAGRDLAKAEAAAASLAPASIEARALDVSDPASVAAFVARLASDEVIVNVLVNNADIALQGFDADRAAATLNVNYFGAARVTDAVLPLMPAGGRVVMVSSGMGELSAYSPELRERFLARALDRAALDALVNSFVNDVRRGLHEQRGWPSNAYRVSKDALNAYFRILAPSLTTRGVLVNAVCPGWVRTDLGGAGASRSVETGATGVVWAATLPANGPSGGFFRDGRAIAW